MRILLQRVNSASVSVAGQVVAEIGAGLLCLCGISTTDSAADSDWASSKILSTRLWPNEKEKPWMQSVKSKDLAVLIVSQFTLHGVLKGNKPDFHQSMPPEKAKLFFQSFVDEVIKKHPSGNVAVGVFGAHMQVDLVNDGPVTLMLDSDEAGFKKTKKYQRGQSDGNPSDSSVGPGGMSKKQAKREKRKLEKLQKYGGESSKERKEQAQAQEQEQGATKREVVNAGGQSYSIVEAPEMIPIGFKGMVNDATNHRLIVREGVDASDTRIVVIGSGFHVAVALSPTPLGVTPDIKGDFDPNNAQGKICFATIDEICTSVDTATSVKIRHNPLDDEYENSKGDVVAMRLVTEKRAAQLEEYKSNFVLWLRSLSTAPSSTCVTFVRNVYPINAATKQYVTKSAKPVWCTGLGVDLCLDCGSGKVALVDGVLGTQLQIGETLKWNTEQEWTKEEITSHVKCLQKIVEQRGGGPSGRKIIAYGTGNWRKLHMETTWPRFQEAMNKINVEFNLLPGLLEAKYGGISSLKLGAPYAPDCKSWIVVEMGGGSTQITRFVKK